MIKALFYPDKLQADRINRLAKFAVMLIAFSVFLPYPITSSLTLGTGLAFCLLPSIRKTLFAKKSVFIAFGFLLLTATVALCYGNYVGFRRTCVFAALVGVVSVARALADKSFFEKLMNVFVIGGCLASLQGIIEFAVNLSVADYRSIGFYTNPNFFGTALTLVILICAYKASTHASHVWLYYAVAVLNAVALYLSGSMSLWLVAIICIILMLALHREYKLLIIFSSLILLAVIVLLAVPDLIHRLDELSATIDNRVKIWTFAIKNFKEAPLFGHGFYSYKFLYSQLAQPNDVYPASMSHSIYLDSLLCHGIVGTAVVATAFISYFVSLFSCRIGLKRQSKKSPITGFIIALSVAFALYGLMDTTFIWIQTGAILMLIGSGLGVEEKELNSM